jgi:membrane-associated phospholipid phosphatase
VLNNDELKNRVVDNFTNVKYWLLIPPFLFLSLCCLYFVLFIEKGNYIDEYVNIQKDSFFYLNSKLSEFPSLQFNLTQLGDVQISFSLLCVFILYAPKLWESLLISAILSLIVSATLKKLFAVPRPAAILDIDSFVIIGRTLSGRTSLPSGHSIATFVVISTLLFAFMPKKNIPKTMWVFSMLTLGFVISFSRVGVGAHYPVDVIVGSTIGYILTIIGIKISNKINWSAWIINKKHHPIFMAALLVWMCAIGKKILESNLLIFYISLISLIATLYFVTSSYVKKKN